MLLTRLVNPLHLAVLRSPLHGMLSRWLVGLSFGGHRTGRPYRLPIGHARVGDRVLVGTDGRWRRNFAQDHPAAVWVRGERREAVGRIVTGPDRLPAAWAALLARRPVVGRLAGITSASRGTATDRRPDGPAEAGRLDPAELAAAAGRGWVVIELRLGERMDRQDLAGRVAVVTGATSGIGREVARALAVRGATVTAVGRDETRGRALAAEHAGIAFLRADLADQAQVRAVAAVAPGRIDILVHSAGGHVLDRRLTADGVEGNWAVNYVSKFLLTELLRDRLAPAGRIVVVGSPVVDPARLLDLGGARSLPRVPVRAMLDSGLATAVWTAALARRLAGTGVTVANVNPVMVATGISRTWPAPLRALDGLAQTVAGLPVEEGALAPVWLATTAELPALFFRGAAPARVPRSTLDPALGDRLWRLSEDLTAAAR